MLIISSKIMRHIAITGDLGSGKSSVAKLISQQTAYEYFSTGLLQRKLAAEKGMNTLELNYLSETTNEIDDYIDAFLKKIDSETEVKQAYVLDSRLAWHFVKSAFKVYLKVQPDLAAERVLADQNRSNEPQTADLEASKKSLLERQEVEARRFKKLYQIDYQKPDNYDLVIDTSNFTPEEVAAQILAVADPLSILTRDDLKQIEAEGIEIEQIREQLKNFIQGFPYLKPEASASTDKGILIIDHELENTLLEAWDNYLQNQHKVLKFVPASGAASRMFKDLYNYLESDKEEPSGMAEKIFISHSGCFAFSEELNNNCLKVLNKSIDTLLQEGRPKDIVRQLLYSQGLNYGSLPKGLLSFHSYPDGPRKAMTEHLIEGALYAPNYDGRVYVHFTVSPEHLNLFKNECRKVIPDIEKQYEIKIEVSFSIQKTSTDTLAVGKNNLPFRDAGKLLFRPGGHGALLENLNDLDADIVFIKNIDNVVPDRLKDNTVHYKKLLAGLLVSLQEKVGNYLRLLDTGKQSRAQLIEIIQFLQQQLYTRHKGIKNMEDAELVLYLKKKLNRPIRVCGMVRNEGEPGGGPFLVQDQDGSTSLQILESSQIDLDNPQLVAMYKEGTHFNPVDLVCGIKDYKAEKFDLRDYVDKNTGFISTKSKNGQEHKALELPGLWNGAMSDWITVFVEVPIGTFNPVKTVNDLLREQHQDVEPSCL